MPQENQPAAKSSETPDLDPGPIISGAEYLIVGGLAVTWDVASWFGADLPTFKLGGVTIGGILGFWAKFRIKKFPTKNFLTKGIVEIVPIIGDISPTWSLFVWRVYRDQNKRLAEIEATKTEMETAKTKE